MVKLLCKQLLRNIRSSLGQFLSIALVVAVGAFFFVGMNEASRTIKRNVDDYYTDTNLAAVTGVFGVAGGCAVKEAARVTGSVAEGRYMVQTSTTVRGNRYDTVLLTRTEQINKPRITAGREAVASGECIVDETFAAANDVRVGDTVEIFNPQVKAVYLQTDGGLDPNHLVIDNYTVTYTRAQDADARTVTATVSGLFIAPEYLYKINQADISAARDEFAVIIVPYEDIRPTTDTVLFYTSNSNTPFYAAQVAADTALFNQVLVADTSLSPDAVFAAYETPFIDLETGDFAVYVSNMSYVLADGSSEKSFRTAFQQISGLVGIIPTLFFLVAAIITFISLSKMVDNERTQIAVMQAIGRRKAAVYFMYTAYALVAALIGTLLGGAVGMAVLPRIYHEVFALQFIMPAFHADLGGLYIVLGALLACGVAAAAAGVSIFKTLRLTPAAAMRPKKEKVGRSVLVDKWGGLWKHLGFGTKMVVRNIFRNKLRILLSSVGVVGSVMLLIMGLGLYDSVECASDTYGKSLNYDYHIVTDVPVSLESPAIEGITGNLTAAPVYAVNVSFANKTSEMVQVCSLPEGNFSIKLADRNNNLLTMSDISLILPHFLAEDLGIKTGDTVTLSGVYGQYDCEVTGIAVQYLMPTVYCGKRVYENLKVPLYTETFYLSDTTLTHEQIADNSAVKFVRTRDEMLDRALSTAVILNLFVAIIVLGAAVLALTVIYNVTAINVHERARELATLMVLGYRRGETSRLIVSENIVTTLLGCLIGLPMGYGLFRWIVVISASMNVSLPVMLTAPVVLLSFGLAFAFSMAATALLLRKVFKIDMVSALKSAE